MALERLEAAFADQRRLWPVWLAVALGTGIAVYFALPVEPAWWIGGAGMVAGLVGGLVFRRRDLALAVFILLGLMAAGFAAAQVRTALVDGRMLAARMDPALYVGVVEQIELLPAGQRITLRDVDIKDLPRSETPQRIRIRVVTAAPDLRVGQKVGGITTLRPPGGPAAPGAYDFRRQAFFAELGADGFGFRPPKILEQPKASGFGGWMQRASDGIAAMRAAIANDIRAQLPDASGAMAIALTVGDQTALRAGDINAMRDSGLAHLLSISGLHIAIAAGLFFFGVRLLLSFVPAVALRYPVKKWAAVVAIAAAALYAGLAGWTTPTQRSLIMAGMAFFAIIVDRSPISLQLVAWAALIVLLFQPDTLMGASFQMSFAAVFALVAVFDRLGPWLAARRQKWGEGATWDAKAFGVVGNFALWLAASIVTSFIAGLATLPFAVFHFDRLSIYGVAANAIAVPLTAFWIMPSAAVALMLMPFGWEGPALQVMGWGCDALLGVAHWVAGWPGAIAVVPTMPGIALAVVAVGLLWLGMARGRWRWLGAGAIAAAMASAWIVPRPDILISPSGKLVAFRAPDNTLILSSNRAERLVRDSWLRRNGQIGFRDIADLEAGDSWLHCTEDVCDYGPVRVVLSATAVCSAAPLLVLAKSAKSSDCTAARIIDSADLSARGAHAVYLDGDAIEVVDALSMIGRRPWAPPIPSVNDDDGGADQ